MKYFASILFLLLSTCTFSQVKVLFIGNSLTAWHDQPVTFEKLAASSGKDVYVVNIARPGMSLQNHCDSEITHEMIYAEKWDYVIIQDSRYEIAFPEYHYVLDPQINFLKSKIYDNCYATEIIFFLDYSMKDGVTALGVYYDYNEFQDILTAGTLQYINNELIIGPVGEAIRTSRNDNPGFELIEDDLVHPTIYGAYLTACVYYSTIFREECNGNSYYDELNELDALYLQSVASNVVTNNFEKWNNVINNYTQMSISYIVTDASVDNGSDGSISIDVCGGQKPYLYKIDDDDYIEENTFYNLSSGMYEIKVKDDLDSIETVNVRVGQSSEVTGIKINDQENITVKPSIVNNWIVIESNNATNINYVEIYSISSGIKIKTLNACSSELKINLSDINSGIYVLKIASGGNIVFKKILKL